MERLACGYGRRQFLRRTAFAPLGMALGTPWLRALAARQSAGAQQTAGAQAPTTGQGPSAPAAPGIESAFAQADRSAQIAGYSISKVQRWLKEKALPLIDPKTGLYLGDAHWNYRDTAADCYPFLCWAAWLVDPKALQGPVLGVLEAEQRLCNHLDRIPVRFDLARSTRDTSVSYEEMFFGASEYVKDGLIAIVEATGRGPWYERMKGIEEDLWKHAQVDTPFGKIPSTNIEVNGEQLQALTRLFWSEADERFLAWARRLADYYLADPQFVPQRLRDHGCEIIGGLGLLLGVESEIGSSKAQEYADRLQRMFDAILARGTNEDGLMFNILGNPQSGLSDGWGYNYVGLLCHDMATGKPVYRAQVAKTLRNLLKPAYKNYRWEGSIDGFADSIEGAIYLLNRLPVAEGLAWVDEEMARNVVYAHQPLATAELWGTMKLQANGVRTVIMHALMHTRGVVARDWRSDLKLGAAPAGKDGLAIVLKADKRWQGRLCFDIPRHRVFWRMKHDWPRMNTLPEWFTVEAEKIYRVIAARGRVQRCSGEQLHGGLAVSVEAEEPLRLIVHPEVQPG